VRRVDNEQLDVTFQEGIDWAPKRGGAFHDDMRTLFRPQPVAQCEQVLGHGAVAANVLANAPIRRGHQQAGDDELLVNIQAAAVLVQDTHNAPLLSVPGLCLSE